MRATNSLPKSPSAQSAVPELPQLVLHLLHHRLYLVDCSCRHPLALRKQQLQHGVGAYMINRICRCSCSQDLYILSVVQRCVSELSVEDWRVERVSGGTKLGRGERVSPIRQARSHMNGWQLSASLGLVLSFHFVAFATPRDCETEHIDRFFSISIANRHFGRAL
jgi:hypothetical protein